jgi:hypothetical protein
MRVQIEIDADRYRQTNMVRIGTSSELVAN